MTDPSFRGRGGLGRQFSWIAVGRIASAVLQALALILVVRQVPPAEFGLLAAAMGLVVVLQSGFDFGLPTLAARTRATDASDPTVWKALRLNAWTSLLLVVVLAALWSTLAISEPNYWFLFPLALSAALERLSDARLGVAVADGDARHNFVGLISRRAIALVLFLVLSLILSIEPVLAFTSSAVVGAAASAIYARTVVIVGRPAASTVPSAIFVFREAWHFWVNSFAVQLRNLDATLATLFGGAVQGGFYGLASRLAAPLRLPASSMGAALLPAAARATTRAADLTLLRTAGRGWLLCVLLYLAGIPLTPLLLPIIAGSDYDGAVIVLQVTLVGLCFASFCSLFAPLLQGWGRQRSVAVSALLSTAVCLGGVVLGSMLLGATGAALALAGSFVVQAAMIATMVVRFMSAGRESAGE